MESKQYKCKDCGCEISEEEYDDNDGLCDYCFHEHNYLKNMKGIYYSITQATFDQLYEQMFETNKWKKRVVVTYEDE